MYLLLRRDRPVVPAPILRCIRPRGRRHCLRRNPLWHLPNHQQMSQPNLQPICRLLLLQRTPLNRPLISRVGPIRLLALNRAPLLPKSLHPNPALLLPRTPHWNHRNNQRGSQLGDRRGNQRGHQHVNQPNNQLHRLRFRQQTDPPPNPLHTNRFSSETNSTSTRTSASTSPEVSQSASLPKRASQSNSPMGANPNWMPTRGLTARVSSP
mmetsp:Transcript_12724/g.27445  ORF Transcript_12724/g.27445 Transcript_12724/m.27445 type:complete len:210 (+) Transcript_12724:627-1256(+)